MPATQATTLAQRREMLRLVEAGLTYAAVAKQVGVSFWIARRGKSATASNMPGRIRMLQLPLILSLASSCSPKYNMKLEKGKVSRS